jgi:hypothetical protein
LPAVHSGCGCDDAMCRAYGLASQLGQVRAEVGASDPPDSMAHLLLLVKDVLAEIMAGDADGRSQGPHVFRDILRAAACDMHEHNKAESGGTVLASFAMQYDFSVGKQVFIADADYVVAVQAPVGYMANVEKQRRELALHVAPVNNAPARFRFTSDDKHVVVKAVEEIPCKVIFTAKP